MRIKMAEEKQNIDNEQNIDNNENKQKKEKFKPTNRSEIIKMVEATNLSEISKKEEAPKEEEKPAQQTGKKKKKKEKKDERFDFKIGDTVKVWVKIIEGQGKKLKERLQGFEGIVIAINGKGLAKSFTVRKVSYGVGVERVFPFHSPLIGRVEITRKGKVRRAKLYYLRDRIGKAAQVKRKEYRKASK
jgi:large subunit ribosomal protein L19